MENKTYHLEYQRDRYQKRLFEALVTLGSCCVTCGSRSLLQFDHVDPTQKKYVITEMLSKYSWEKIEEELAKCQLLCKGCHELKTARETRLRTPWNKGLCKPAEHGSLRMYNVFRCRCERCKQAKRESRTPSPRSSGE